VTAELPVREDLRASTPYGAPQLDVPVRLNTNENSYDVPQDVAIAVVEAVARQVQHLNRYPDREFSALREALAGYLTSSTGQPIEAGQVWAANGSNEVLQQLLQAFGGSGRQALGFTPAYSMHPRIAQVTGTGWVDGHRADPASGDFHLTPSAAREQVRAHDPDVVFICSPNNPTGTAIGLDVVQAVYDASDHAVVVVDEAYAEFARVGTPSALELLPGRPRLVVTRTMSKAFAFAGARVGYLAADPAVGDALRLVRLPYHLSTLTQAAACAAIGHAATLLATVEAIKVQRDRIVEQLQRLGLRPVPSDANFVLFGGLSDEQATWSALLDHGVLIRDVSLAGHLRVTAGTEPETTAFLTALAAVTTGQLSRESA
jgi:histidinol-phosphate aminotransferase